MDETTPSSISDRPHDAFREEEPKEEKTKWKRRVSASRKRMMPKAHHPVPVVVAPAHELPIPLYRRVALTFAVITAVLLIAVVFASSARATITVVPKAETLRETLTLPLNNSDAHALRGVMLTKETTVQDVFLIQEGHEVEGYAEGEVIIKNTTPRSMMLVRRTRLLTNTGVLFRIVKDTTVPAKGEVKVTARADVAGASGNIGPTRFTIPGLSDELQEKVYAESAEPLRGGIRKEGVVGAEDTNRARDELVGKAVAEVKRGLDGEIATTALSGFKLDERIEVLQHEVRVENVRPSIGERSDSFTMELNVKVTVAALERARVVSALTDALRARAEQNTEVGEVSDVRVALKEMQGDDAVFTVSGAASQTVQPDAPFFDAENFAGKTTKEAQEYLVSLPLVESSSVELRPAWKRKLPDASRVKVIVVQRGE